MPRQVNLILWMKCMYVRVSSDPLYCSVHCFFFMYDIEEFKYVFLRKWGRDAKKHFTPCFWLLELRGPYFEIFWIRTRWFSDDPIGSFPILDSYNWYKCILCKRRDLQRWTGVFYKTNATNCDAGVSSHHHHRQITSGVAMTACQL